MSEAAKPQTRDGETQQIGQAARLAAGGMRLAKVPLPGGCTRAAETLVEGAKSWVETAAGKSDIGSGRGI